MFPRQNGRVPVYAGPRIREFAGPERVRRLLAAPNVRPVVKHKTGAVVGVELLEWGDDSRLDARGGNPLRLSHNHETPENPPRCWMFKQLTVEG
jgi:hypothetical protein